MLSIKQLNLENNFEAKLLLELSPEISNFRKGFKGRLTYTYVLTPYGSSMFDVDILNGEVLLAVPESLYKILYQIPINNISIIKNKPGIYLVYRLGQGDLSHDISIRIHVRRRRVNVLMKFKEIRLVPITPLGEVIDGYDDKYMLKLSAIKALTWEK